MTAGFQVDAERLRQDAKAIDEVIADVELAVDAGKEVTPAGWDLAFGSLFQFMAQADHAAASVLIGAIGTSEQALRAMQTKLQAVADSYADTDGSNADELTKIHEPADLVRPIPGQPGQPGFGVPVSPGESVRPR